MLRWFRRLPIATRLGLVLLVVAAAAAAAVPALRSGLVEGWNVLTSGEQERIRTWVEDKGAWGPALVVLLMVAQMFLLVVPSWLLMVISVLAYGAWLGGALAVVSVLVASTIGYGLGRVVGEHGLDRLIGRKARQSVEAEVDRYGHWAVFVARLNPLLSNDAISLVGGILRMGFGKFILATLAGIAPLAGIIAAMGRDWTEMKTALIWLSAVSLAGLLVKLVVDRRERRRREDDADGEREPRAARAGTAGAGDSSRT